MLLLLPRARRLLAAHPATLPPRLTTGGAAVLPLSGHPAEAGETAGIFTINQALIGP